MRWIADLFIFSSIYDLNLKNKNCLNMDEIKDNIVCFLPNISEEVLQKLITAIQELGVNEKTIWFLSKKMTLTQIFDL